ncbi:glycosyltransferase [Ensifer adhaerens]|uniref:glycosyltransferase family 2 protein n=1 Tax=Ensifer adhaerens TaxID=106592 RepID=UPI001CBA78A7|nr:glycosyltransferase [Ensifer adhaerens]MBZ7925440.1 glycosyltransferase [Ensifer adhaerens]UAX95400.1 glycosyltransferase [Ensifer adhaerens]UAY02708.1 glycosyltransferase [Ensifer adhaerens]UAY10692.1 glycosyltransferase [Ensifer adhaerens]
MKLSDVSRNGASISIIVPTYNRAQYLPASLDALLPQIGRDDEIIVVVDGSTDETADVLARYGNRIEVIEQANAGKARALNAGLQKCRGQFVWIVDDDDVVCPTALGDLMQVFEADPSAGIAYGRYVRFQHEKDGAAKFLDTGYWNDCPTNEFLIATLEDFFVHQPGMLVRRSLYDAAGAFDEALPRSVDYDMLIRLSLLGKAASTANVIFHQRLHDGDRGPAASRFQAQRRDQNWISNDALIFDRLHQTLPLTDYLPSRRIESGDEERSALLQRGAIMARKKRWDIAISDFGRALEQSRSPLTPYEKRILRRATGSKYDCDEVFGNALIDEGLRSLSGSFPPGRELARSLARGLVWRARQAAAQGQLKRSSRIAAQACRWAAASWG